MPKTPTKSFKSNEEDPPYDRTPTRSMGNFDKYECSPNSRSKCGMCKRKIEAGTKRVGKKCYNQRYGNHFRYYHDHCFPNKHTLSLPGGRTPEDELAKQKKDERQNSNLLIERETLREMLRQVRRAYAQRLGCSDRAFLVFQDTTLDDLTIKLPRNKKEMLLVYGMGPKRFQNVGEPLLQVIENYLKDEERSQMKASPGQPANNRARQTSSLKTSIYDSGGNASDSDEEIVIGETLTVDQIVNQAFAEAEARGDIITLDDDEFTL